jgi:putative ABC transport system permease protein
VFADFHNESMKREIAPMILQIGPNTRNAILRLQTNDIAGALAGVEEVWNTFKPGLPFQYSFLDDDFDAMYRSEQRLAGLFGMFSTVAIFIAMLGLFGLAAYTAQQRTKEIGIRKVLGASVSGLVVMLSKEFIRLVLIAFIVAAPLAYFAMDNWLSSFAYHIEIGLGIFMLSGALALVVALGTVSWQALRAATANPVTSLRNE